MRKSRFILVVVLAIASAATTAFGFWAPDWEVNFSDTVDTGAKEYTDNFTIGAGGNGIDAYGLAGDILEVLPPGWPDSGDTHSDFNKPFVAMSSSVGGTLLAKDARDTVTGTTVWNIEKRAGASLTGSETITWSVVPGIIPSMTLKDYTDASRTTEVASIDSI